MKDIKHYGVKGMRWGSRKRLTNINNLMEYKSSLYGKDRRNVKQILKNVNRIDDKNIEKAHKKYKEKHLYNKEVQRYYRNKTKPIKKALLYGTKYAGLLMANYEKGKKLRYGKALRQLIAMEAANIIIKKGVDPGFIKNVKRKG